MWAEGGLTEEEQTDANRAGFENKGKPAPLEARKEKGRDSPLSLQEGMQHSGRNEPADTFIFASDTMRPSTDTAAS